MFADDIGFNDVEFTAAELTQNTENPTTTTQTPHLNELAFEEGVRLQNYYVMRMCSPSRAAFLTGRYPFRYAMSTHLLQPDTAVSLTRQMSLVSEEFKAAGYATHAIGKWHLGFQSWEYTPTYRGFDTFYGYLNAWSDYYLSKYGVVIDNVQELYRDCRDNEAEVVLQGNIPDDFSVYRFRDRAIEILQNAAAAENAEPFFMYLAWQSSHTPSQAPDDYLQIYADEFAAMSAEDSDNFENYETRTYMQAQTTSMDDAVYQVTQKLKALDLWENTLIVFSSDNGGAAGEGDNFPLRGFKKTSFEGGIRVPAFVTGGYLSESMRGRILGVDGEYVHAIDWYPTLLEAAGITPALVKSNRKTEPQVVPQWETDVDYSVALDGVSIWPLLNGDDADEEDGERVSALQQTLRTRLLVLDFVNDEINDVVNGSLRIGHWKYVKGLGTADLYEGDDGWLWGEQFTHFDRDIMHQWGDKFSNTDEDNILGCDLDAEIVNEYCFSTDEGCLFDLDADPCEMQDVSQTNPEIFSTMAATLQALKEQAPSDVMQMESTQLTLDSPVSWLPSGEDAFWSPWGVYGDTMFEQVLYENYDALYGNQERVAEHQKLMQTNLASLHENLLPQPYLESAARISVPLPDMKRLNQQHPPATADDDDVQRKQVRPKKGMRDDDDEEDTTSSSSMVELASSCNTKPDGLWYIKPTAEGAVLPVVCQNGFTMLDASLNFDSLASYLTSVYQYGDSDKVIYGTDCGDSNGWRDWFTPANLHTKFRVARDCESCEAGGIFGDNTGYYMTNGYFCPVMLDIDGCSAYKDLSGQMQPDVMCNICDDTDGRCGAGDGREGASLFDTAHEASWCDCWTLQLSADHKTTDTHAEYCQDDLNWRPNVVLDRTQCTCYQPLDEESMTYMVSTAELPVVSAEYKSDIVDTLAMYVDDLIVWSDEVDSGTTKHDCHRRITYLSQQDFLYGTYRITECGKYVLSEDISVNFNAPETKFSYEAGDSPNSYNFDDFPWYPTTAQQESGLYFGVDAFWGSYSLGFPAAITIETRHVELDLAGYTIEMDYEFYLQQRFFAIVLLSTKPFEARQGPVDFGRDDVCNRDIAIYNGVLGRSSHHGIMGSCVREVEIHDLVIRNFDTHGIQCNGCKQLTIEDVDIGPQNVDIPVRGRYTHGRAILSRLRYLVDNYGESSLQFANRETAVTVRELADRLVEQLDMVYYHVIDGVTFDADDAQWQAAKQTFLNPTGWMDGGSSYGVLLNGYGTAVVNIGRRTTDTFEITLRNVEIHDLAVQPYEGFWAVTPTEKSAESAAVVHGFFFETIDWNPMNGHVYEADTGIYLGDAYTDLLFASNHFFEHDFCPLGSLFFMDGLKDWAFVDGTNVFSHAIGLELRCGSDIQSHSAKGAIGVRIDGVQHFTLENVYVHDVTNWGALGSDMCGEYDQITFESGVDVDADIQYGYTGTKVHGILTDYASGSMTDIRVENLESWYGSANAIAIYKGSDVHLFGEIDIANVVAGSQLSKPEVLQLTLPNATPFVCSILIGPNSEFDESPEVTPSVIPDHALTVTVSELYGYDYCEKATRIGHIDRVSSPQILRGRSKISKSKTSNVLSGELLFAIHQVKNAVLMAVVSIPVVFAIVLYFIYIRNAKQQQQPETRHEKTNFHLSTQYGSF